jgi:hypothetical protein
VNGQKYTYGSRGTKVIKKFAEVVAGDSQLPVAESSFGAATQVYDKAKRQY